jgi:dolichol kinase
MVESANSPRMDLPTSKAERKLEMTLTLFLATVAALWVTLNAPQPILVPVVVTKGGTDG